MLLFAVVLLLPRLGGWDYYPGKYLWAEDGSVFMSHAQSMGFSSLWTPYAGYLQVYPRLVALVADQFELLRRPSIFLVGWLLAYVTMFWALASRATNLGSGIFSILSLFVLVSLQPSYGETFLNLTNSQWLTGATLSLMVLADAAPSRRPALAKIPLLVLLGLSGPFSIVLLCPLAIRAFYLRDVRQNAVLYATIVGCALIQAVVLMKSGRASPVGLDPQAWHWIDAFLAIVLLGASGIVGKVAAVAFWLVLAFAIVTGPRPFTDRTPKSLVPALSLVTALLFIGASLYSTKGNPMAVAATGGGNRYTWIPYTLLFFSAIVATNGKPVSRLVLFLLALFACQQNFHKIPDSNLQFRSFANFAQHHPVLIPTAPQWPAFPGWSIEGEPTTTPRGELWNSTPLPLQIFVPLNGPNRFSGSGLEFTSTSTDPALVSSGRILCGQASDVAIEVDLDRPADGWVQFSWSRDRSFPEARSLRRWYPAGPVNAQFAFPNNPGGNYIRLDPMETAGKVGISKITAYCLR